MPRRYSRIRVVRAAPPAAMAAAPVVVAPTPVAPAAAVAAADEASHPCVVSPMVGVAYLSPDRGAAPFITVGQSVVPGQTLLLIEA